MVKDFFHLFVNYSTSKKVDSFSLILCTVTHNQKSESRKNKLNKLFFYPQKEHNFSEIEGSHAGNHTLGQTLDRMRTTRNFWETNILSSS